MATFDEMRCKEELDIQKLKGLSKTAAENVLEYYNKHKDFCNLAYEYYLQYNESKEEIVNLNTSCSKNIICDAVKGNAILVITANPIELGIFMRNSFILFNKIETYTYKQYEYHVIDVYKYTIIHVHTNGTGDERARRAINAAYKLFGMKIRIVVLLGICYGIDLRRQKVGEVIISDSVLGYRINFREKDANPYNISFEPELEFEIVPNRMRTETIKTRLSVRSFENSLLAVANSKLRIIVQSGKVLSSNCLMSSRVVKQALLEAFGTAKPQPMAGEMEGSGIFKSNIFENEETFDNWIIIKAICDWGESKNLLSTNEEDNEYIKNNGSSLKVGDRH